MKLHKPTADIFIPDGAPLEAALARTTHLGVGAHQDDLEVIALHGIFGCFGRSDRGFSAVTCTDGRGSARTGIYADYTDDDMMRVRQEEQRAAAKLGRYAACLQLMYSSAESKDPANAALTGDLEAILRATRPTVVYTHNPADKHPTHLGVFCAVLAAVRRLPPAERPEAVYGCEVWRDLDWMPDDKKVVFDVGGRDHLANALMGTYDSQIAGGKRYDLAVAGRRVVNATFYNAHAVDQSTGSWFAMDLTPLVRDDALDPVVYVTGYIDVFRASVASQLQALLRR